MKLRINLILACLALAAAVLGQTTIIPLPGKIQAESGVFRLLPGAAIVSDAAVSSEARYLEESLRQPTGFAFSHETNAGRPYILLTIRDADKTLGEEGYELTVTPQAVVIRAPASAGVFYGIQTLRQLFPAQIFSTTNWTGSEWVAPCVKIRDQPRFQWRGFMLDVARHFFNKAEVEQMLDLMAMHKLNVFHWHLADDQGWRIQIDKYPRLTQVGAWRKAIGFGLDPADSTAYGPDGRYGGFYTKADIREIVAYAHARHILVVPEIEMPGHSTAALAAYPQYSCTGGPFSTDIQAGIFDGIYCPGNEQTFGFLEDVLAEVFELFPDKYIHIGGDEVPKDNWEHCPKCQALMKREGLKNAQELQSYFIRRIEKFINQHGRTLIGWTEIAEGGLTPNAVVMDWKGGGGEAARAGHDVVMASQASTYLCYYPSLDRLPWLKAYRPYLPISQVYAFDPAAPDLDSRSAGHILGVEACQWTVFFGSWEQVEMMTFPRLVALAEVAWTPKELRNWADFSRRLGTDCERLNRCGAKYWQDKATQIGGWQPSQLLSTTHLEWAAPITEAGRYRISVNYVQGRDGLKIEAVALLENGVEIARDTHPGSTGAGYRKEFPAHDWNYYLNVGPIKEGARYTVRAAVSVEGGGTDSTGAVFLEKMSSNHP